MMTSSNGNIFRVTGHFCGEFTGQRWIPRTNTSDVELWCFLWSAPWINGWVNNREAGDLRRHRARYDVIVMGLFPLGWYHYTPTQRSCWGLYWFHSVRPSVRPASRVRSVASTVQDGFFPYLIQMINGMRGCVACDDPWPWPISSRSLGLHLENRVRSVASTVLDGFFLYMAQIITIIRECVACYVFVQNLQIWIFGKFLKLSALTFKFFFTVLEGFSFHI